uniref:Protein N-lysine methyltransferase METTL21A n=1 Tax=Auxenochlorella protothecoides TaxID=3075 RepID=A0A1D1ZWE0_AUXPR
MPLEERWNTHFSTSVEQELFGVRLTFAQDPNSENLGTTVWDASIVLAKFLEKNARKGEWSTVRVKGKRCLELGAGMGLAGAAMALMGAHVTFTDLESVLPLLRQNVQNNLTPSALRLSGADAAAARVGTASVAPLDWADAAAYASLGPPFPFLLAADCIYAEGAVPHFLATLLALTVPSSRILVTNEFRSASVHAAFLAGCEGVFTLRRVPVSKLDPAYEHPAIHIYALSRARQAVRDQSGRSVLT